MQIFIDYKGNEIRLPDERRRHIRQRHPRVLRIPNAIALTLADPHDIEPGPYGARVYTRWFEDANRWVIVVVNMRVHDPFILTAYTE